MPPSTQPMMPRFWPPLLGRTKMLQRAGERVRALIAEITMATLVVTAHCRNKTPVRPGMKAIGHENREQHQGDGDDRRRNFGHGPFGRLSRGEFRMLLHD